MTTEGARGKSLLDLARDLPEDPAGCIACGAIAGCCDKYPNCPGNPDWKPVEPSSVSEPDDR